MPLLACHPPPIRRSLQILFRAHSAGSLYTAAAGCWRVNMPGVEDVNVSRVIKSAADYVTNIGEVLDAINLTGGE